MYTYISFDNLIYSVNDMVILNHIIVINIILER